MVGPRIQIGALPQRNQRVPDNAAAVVSGWGNLIVSVRNTVFTLSQSYSNILSNVYRKMDRRR